MRRPLKDEQEFAGSEGERHILGRVGSTYAGEKVSTTQEGRRRLEMWVVAG